MGLPNVGKSTLFNAITKAGAEAANFPFCTIEPNVGIVEVPDPSGLFTSQHAEPVPGTCVTVTMEGSRPMLAEVQSLVVPVAQDAPAP